MLHVFSRTQSSTTSEITRHLYMIHCFHFYCTWAQIIYKKTPKLEIILALNESTTGTNHFIGMNVSFGFIHAFSISSNSQMKQSA